jgi:type I restriction enzyme S subunit
VTVAWRSLPFDEAIHDISAGNPKLQTGDYLQAGRYPIVDQGKDLIAGYYDDPSALARISGPAIIFGDHTRAIKYADFDFCVGADGVKILKPINDIDPKYAFHFLSSIKLPSAGYSRHFKFLRRLDVIFPPLDEQRRIAAILDQTDELRRKRREAIQYLDKLRSTFFNSAFGDLAQNKKDWEREKFDTLIENIDSGWSPICLDRPATADEWGVLKLSAVTRCEYDDREQKALPIAVLPRSDIEVKTGDILITRKNTRDLVAACALVTHTRPRLMLSDLIFRIRLKPHAQVEPAFIHGLLTQPSKRRAIQALAGGSAGSMPNISKEKLRTVLVEMPPIALQRTFATRVAEIDNLKALHRGHLAKLDALFASLQHRAFRGDL